MVPPLEEGERPVKCLPRFPPVTSEFLQCNGENTPQGRRVVARARWERQRLLTAVTQDTRVHHVDTKTMKPLCGDAMGALFYTSLNHHRGCGFTGGRTP